MTLGAFLVVAGLVLIYGAISDQNALEAVSFVLKGAPATGAHNTAPRAATAATAASAPLAP